MQHDYLLYAAAAVLTISMAATIPAVRTITHGSWAQSAGHIDGKYRDRDGEATPESISAFSTRWQKLLVLFCAFAGLGCQIAFTVILNAPPARDQLKHLLLPNWLVTASWGLLDVQAIAIGANRNFVGAFQQGVYLSVSTLAVTILLLAQLNVTSTWQTAGKVALTLCAASTLAASILTLASLSLPRRPDVFLNGRLVDRMFTVNANTRLTFGWATNLMSLATKKGDLDMADLPRLSHRLRPDEQSAEWESKRPSANESVFKTLLKIYGWPLSKQWITTMTNTSVSYLPWWITLQLLQALEARKPGEPVEPRLWLFVAWLGMARITNALLDNWLFWNMVSELYVPVRSQLAAVIFQKAMRRKNVKAAGKARNDDKTSEQVTSSEVDGADGDTTGQKSRQAVINLIGVDANRVSEFSLFQYMFPTSILQFVISMWFLIYLLGWVPLTLGILSISLTIPINSIFAKMMFKTNEKLMKIRDEKLELVNEALQGIRQIKFSALESQWENRILRLRQRELATLWEYFRYNIILDSCWNSGPILLALTSLGSYAWIHGNLTASVAFVSIGVLSTLDFAISAMPALIRHGIDCWVSLNRIQKYMDGPELSPARTNTERADISFQDACLAWPVDDQDKPTEDSADRFALRDVTFSFPPGELSVISGNTGSGKSLMLAAIIGEADILSGSVTIPAPPTLNERYDDRANPESWILPSSIAYVGQLPWIENATLRDNVLFGMPFDKDRYEQTLAACALTKDLETLVDGDKTELGVNGVNLSGGQKWRVTVARAVYSRAGILVMDDIFSAVDAHVSRHILENCLAGSLCKGRTRILVTHHVTLVEKHARFIIELADGTVRCSGLTEDLRKQRVLERIESFEQHGLNEGAADSEPEEEPSGIPLKKQSSRVPQKFVEDEAREKGSVKGHIYATYLKDSGGWTYWCLLMGFYLLFQAAQIAQPWVVRLWTGGAEESSLTMFQAARTQSELPYTSQQGFLSRGQYRQNTSSQELGGQEGREVRFWLPIYAAVCLAGVLSGTARYIMTFRASYRASKIMFEKILFAVLRTPLRWTDTVPVGRILNRFTADFNVIDNDLAQMGEWFLSTGLQAVGICAASLFVSPLIAPLAALCLGWCAWLGMVYLTAARPAKRLESTSKSPIFDFFGSALTGLTTIRAFDRTTPYIQAMHAKIEEYSMCSMNLSLFNRWIGWNMSVAGIAFTITVTVFVLLQAGIDAALAGFVLSFTMRFSNTVLITVRAYAELELEMNAVERVVEYSEIETEDFGGEKPPAAWPTQGRLEVNKLVVAYAPHLSPVLKDVSFQINPAERIGVVGRTGAGKSSLTLALFRFLEARSGSIYVDGLNIAKIPLSDLRSRLAIIPQDPVLFSGTVRTNLDSFDDHTEAELNDALHRVHLVSEDNSMSSSATVSDNGPSSPTSIISNSEPTATNPTAAGGPTTTKNVNIFQDLSSPISEGGHNLSQGQRQLLCLARAIVSRPKIMVLDEATSAVDMATDTLIQRSIREEFKASTLIVIAHRLSTIADFDRILVLSGGAVVEFGTPLDLWKKEDGIFRSMCEESGEKAKLKTMILGEGLSGVNE